MLDFKEKAKACCSLAHERLVKQLDACDSKYGNSRKHHRCYQIAARRAGGLSKKCITGG